MTAANKHSAILALIGWLLGGLMLVSPAAAASLRAPTKATVGSVSVSKIQLRWKDRSGERYFELQGRAAGEDWRPRRIKRNRERGMVRGLASGVLVELRVRACRRAGRCSPFSATRKQATLLAPFNGPHPPLGCETFPAGDSFNRDVSGDPLDPDSAQIISRINADGADQVHPDFGSNPRYGIPYVVVPGVQPGVPISFGDFGDESDPGPYPIPPRSPIEGKGADGDRHVLVVQRPTTPGGACRLFELYRSFQKGGTRNRWSGDSGAVFDLGSPLAGQRPADWTSADAAGLPIFPGLATYEEASSGEIDHALRITFEQTRREYLSPATHYASDSCNSFRPPMGMRLRLTAGYDTSGLSGRALTIAEALKSYGAIVADNGSNWYISGSTDRRWPDGNLNGLKEIPGTAFEVVDVPGTTSASPC